MSRTIVACLLLGVLLQACRPPAAEPQAELAPGEAHGPHGGVLLTDGPFALELAIYELGVAPEFHAWATEAGRPLDPASVELEVALKRLGGAVDRFRFAPVGDFLRGAGEVREPHSFDVAVTARAGGATHAWSYASYEGRTVIAAEIAAASGIETARAGPGTIVTSLELYGAIAPDSTRVREVRARFPGLIVSAPKAVGAAVRAGETLATVESNESLRTYAVAAPIDGTIVSRHAEPGEQAGADALFEVADYSTVWAELTVFASDRARVRPGAAVEVAAGGATASGTVGFVSPVGRSGSQSVVARVVLDNRDGRFTPGQFVSARVALASADVPIAVPPAALQRWADFDVVFARVGDTYEVRMLELGRRDARAVEVLKGLEPGAEYVVANSYLVKADIEKSGASHDE